MCTNTLCSVHTCLLDGVDEYAEEEGERHHTTAVDEEKHWKGGGEGRGREGRGGEGRGGYSHHWEHKDIHAVRVAHGS